MTTPGTPHVEYFDQLTGDGQSICCLKYVFSHFSLFSIKITLERSKQVQTCVKKEKNYTTLALIAIPGPMASGSQNGGHGRANRRV